MKEKIEQIMTQEDCGLTIAAWVIIQAADIFKYCGREDDFCLQHVGEYVIIFGGHNRLLWEPIKGFRIDKSACTNAFIEAFSKWQEEQNYDVQTPLYPLKRWVLPNNPTNLECETVFVTTNKGVQQRWNNSKPGLFSIMGEKIRVIDSIEEGHDILKARRDREEQRLEDL